VDWVGAQFGGIFLAAGDSVCDWLVDPITLHELFTNPTLMTSRVVAAADSNTNQTDELAGFGFGLIEWMAKDNELPAICPDVFRDSDLDWILRQVFMQPAFGPVGITALNLVLDLQFASAAKRRLETGASILMVASNSADFGSAGYRYSVDVRCLIKE
jgi:hypothetical protein